MPGTSDPPRPHLSSAVRNYLVSCTWNSQLQRVENGGNPVSAWLNQNGTPAISNPVVWETGTTSQAGTSVQSKITQNTYDIIKNGSYDSNSGLVTYVGKTYRFAFAMSGGLASMLPSQV
jgi:hypothetical protein